MADRGTGPEREPGLPPGASVFDLSEETGPHDALVDPPNRRLRQYGVLAGLVVLTCVFTFVLVWLSIDRSKEAEHANQAAARACAQVVQLGQPCVSAPDIVTDGVTGDAVVPGPIASASLDPTRPAGVGPHRTPRANPSATKVDQNGVPQAYQPLAGATVVALAIAHNHLILTYSDGARLDAGPVEGDLLSIVLGGTTVISPSPSPTPSTEPSTQPSAEPSPSPTPTDETFGPPTFEPEPSGSD